MRLNRERARRAFAVVLFVGALLRIAGIDWDAGHHLHPDERFISMVEEKLEIPKSPAEYFDSARSPLNPYNRGHDSFVYGTLPMFVTKVVAKAIHQDGYGGAHIVGRALSAVADLFSVWLAYLLARRFSRDRRIALAAAALLAFCPLGLQLSHFWNVETYLTAFSTAALLGAVRLAEGRARPLEAAATGVAIGLAVACKVTALALLLPLGLGVSVGALREGIPRETRAAGRTLAKAAGYFALAVAAAAAAARIGLPYAFAGPGFFSFGLDLRYVTDIKRLAELSSSVAGFPPALQWAGRTIFFPLANLVLWGAGPFFGLAALASLVWGILEIRKRPRRALAPLSAHAVFILAYHGTTTVKSIRYFYPAYPAMAVLAALFLAAIASAAGERRAPASRLLRLAPAIVVGATFLWGLAFTSIYRREHPRVTASRWIYENVPPPARIGNEAWDDGQPMPMPDHDSGPYAGPVLPLFDPDSAKKADDVVRALAEADWVAVTSNRVWRNVTRVPEVFPMSRAYYSALFDGRLGFDLAADFSSYPSLGPLKFPDDRAEEQFTVYDHPRVLLFRKTRGFSRERATQILLASMPRTPPTLGDWEKFPRSRRIVSAPIYPPRRAELAKTARRGAAAELEIGSLGSALLWYLALLLVGAVAFPLAHAFLPRLADRGAGVARVLGLVGATWLLAVLVQLRVISNGRGAAWIALVLAALPSAALFVRRRETILGFLRERWRLVAAGEMFFALGFLLFLAIRALNPEIYWGEKPMDFSILNILVRTRTLPASDPWFAGAPLGYYTFGQQMIAFLTLLTGLPTRFTFNLAFGLLGGAMLQGAFTLARNWAGTLRAGIAGAALTAVLGNLAGPREWLVNHRVLDWHYFWATSRVVKDTINEYPFWSLIFADLHAHVLAMPVFLLVATAALHFVRVHSGAPARLVSRVASGTLLGFALAAQALTNAWDAPLLAGLLAVVFIVTASVEGFGPLLARLAPGAAATIVAAWATAAPLWVRGGGGPGWGWEQEPGAKGVDVVTVFGLFFFLAIAWLCTFAAQRMREQGFESRRRLAIALALGALLVILGFLSTEVFALGGVLLFAAAAMDRKTEPEERLACGFVAAAFFLVLFAQRVYISDRMNTFFKLYLEAWLLFALGTAALVFRGKERPGAFGRWPLVVRGAFGLVVLAALFTTVTAARGAVRNHFAAYSGPSLDGLRYLEESRPGEYRAVLWLRRNLRGTPVVLEAQGDPYQDFSRISMNTGLPTVLGWEHHVKQRGNPESEVIERREAIRRIYSARDAREIERLLRRYHVGYVYVGWLERRTYSSEGLRKFDRAKDLFELAYENREAKLYRVVGGDSEDVLAPAREALPAPAPGQEIVEEEEPPAISEKPEEGRPPFSGMKEPRDADLDRKGRLWVADFGNSRLRIFDAEGGFLGGWGGRGDTTYAMKDPCAVSIRGNDVYVADTWNGRVQHFSLAGEWKSKASELYGPRGVAAAPDGKVWVTDTGNHRIVAYDAALNDKRTIGKLGSGPGEFSSPVGIAAGPSGSIYVADTGNRRIQVFDLGGRFLAALPVRGWEGSVEPHLEIGSDRTIYATDPAASVVLAIDAAGGEKRRWATDDEGSRFDRPTGLAIDRKAGILYVINSGNTRVAKLTLTQKKP